MKRYRNLGMLATALLFAAFIFGCSNIIEGTSGNVNTTSGRSVAMQGVISNLGEIDNIEAFAARKSGARTILPPTDSATYKYYFWGKTIDGSKYYPALADGATAPKPYELTTEITTSFTDGAGVFELDIDSEKWEFTLCAISGDAVPANPTEAQASASYIARAFADLSSESVTTNFVLKSDGLEGESLVDLYIFFTDDYAQTLNNSWESRLADPTKLYAHAFIENYKTGEQICEVKLSEGDGGFTADNVTALNAAKADYGLDANISAVGIKAAHFTLPADKTTLAPGTYNFVIRIYDSPHENTTVDTAKVKGVWSDTLIVLPNRATKDVVYVPAIIDKVPEDVAWLTASYVEKSEDASNLGYYKAQFSWSDNVSNENYYELQIADISGLGKKLDDYDWEDDADANGAVIDYTPDGTIPAVDAAETAKSNRTPRSLFGASEYCSGSINKNNGSLVLYLELGKEYAARIRAVNDTGTSKNWTVLELTDGTAATTMDKSTVTFSATSKVKIDGELSGRNGSAKLAYFVGFDKTGYAATVGYPSAALDDDNTKDADFPTPAVAATVNRFRVTYHLNGGQYISSGTSVQMPTVLTTYNTIDADGKGYPHWSGTGTSDGDSKNLRFYDSKTGAYNLFLSWVKEAYFGTPGGSQTDIVYERYGKDAGAYDYSIRKTDNDNFEKCENLDLYAVYSGDKQHLTGNVTTVDYANFKLTMDAVKWNNAIVDGTVAGESSVSVTYDRSVAADKTKLENGIFNVSSANMLPDGGSYDLLKITVSTDNGAPKFMKTADFTGGDVTFDTIDFSEETVYPAGKYTIMFEATKKNSPSDIVRTCSISLTIRN